VLLLFAAAYYLVLRKLTFYRINRVFLMFGILFSSAYPFIDLSGIFDRHTTITAFVPEFNQDLTRFGQNAEPLYWQVLSILFCTGVFIMALRLTMQFISLYRIHKRSDPDFAESYKLRIMKDKLSPFSFWQTIYVNPLLHKKADLDHILEHEKLHVKEWHTLDIIMAEICLVFYWFNPGIWLIKKAVKENIEFITDAKILGKGIDRKAYQYSLLNVSQLDPAVAIANGFNISDLRKRIKMMNTKRSSPLKMSMYLLLLPALILITLAFTIRKQAVSDVKVRTVSKVPETKQRRNVFFLNTDSSGNAPDLLPAGVPAQVRAKIEAFKRKPANGKMVEGTFSFKDTLNGKVRNVFVKLRNSDRAQGNGNRKKLIYIFNRRQKMDNPGDTSGHQKRVGFFLNGEQVTKEEFEKIRTDLLANIKN
jgi:hypothetical protein